MTIKPIEINSICIPSNIFFAPINPGYSKCGKVSDKFVDFFTERSGHCIGVCYVGNVSLDMNWTSNDKTAVLYRNEDTFWKRLSTMIRQKGSVPGIQLAWKPEQISMQREFVNTDLQRQLAVFQGFYDAFDDIDTVADLYTNSIKRCVRNGFSIIQLHAAHGYALSLLLSKGVSRCKSSTDTKGLQLLRKVTEKLSKTALNCILDIRVSLFEGILSETEEMGYKYDLFSQLHGMGFQLISLSNGFYNIDKNMIYPSKSQGTVILDRGIDIATLFPAIQWNIAGNMERVLERSNNFPDNLSFSIGRQLICDPKTVEKAQGKVLFPISECSDCGQCHYYSNGFDGIQKCNGLYGDSF